MNFAARLSQQQAPSTQAPFTPAPPMQGAPMQGAPTQQAVYGQSGGGIFSRIASAKASVASTYLRPGKRLLRIDDVKHLTNTRKGEAVMFEFTVVREIASHPGEGFLPGQTCSDGHFFSKEGCAERIKAALKGITGMDEEALTEDFIQSIILGKVLNGAVVMAESFTKTTRSGQNITATKYHGIVPPSQLKQMLSPEEVAQFFPGDILDRMIQEELKQQG